MKIKIVIVLYNLTTPNPTDRGPEVLMEGTFGTAVLKKETEWNLPLELKNGLQLGVLPGVGPLVIEDVRNDGTLDEPRLTVEIRHRVFEDDTKAYREVVALFLANGFVEGKLFVDTKSAALIFPSKERERFKSYR